MGDIAIDLDSWQGLAWVYAWRAILALAILLLFWLAGIVAARVIARTGRDDPRRADLSNLLAQGAKIGIIAFGVVTALGNAGIDVTALIAGLGLTGFALGFALKDAVSNFVAGVMLISYRPFNRGDRIEVAGVQGNIVRIDLRYTVLDGDEDRFFVPNSTMINGVVRKTGAVPAMPA